MTTYVICDNCNGRFESPIQVENLETNTIQGNRSICPLCHEKTFVEIRNMINE